MLGEVLRHSPALDLRDQDHGATPIGWAIHASTQGWHPERGDYAGTVEALLSAGAQAPEPTAWSDASEPVLAVLRRVTEGR